jgi:nucleoside-diphosphate-sugar epimerase
VHATEVRIVRVLITGAGGFVGQHFAVAMARKRHKVVALVRRPGWPAVLYRPGVQVECADLGDAATLPVGPLDAVIHCAAAIPATVPDAAELFRINVEGSRRLFNHALCCGARTIIFCSSMAAYGRIDADIVDPETPVHDPGAYGRSKLECERLLSELSLSHSGIRALSIRLPGVVGPGSHHNFLSDTVASFAAGVAVTARNPAALFNNVVHVDDLAGFVETLLRSLPSGHRTTTIAAADPLPIREVVGILKAFAPPSATVEYRDDGHSFLISNDRARSLGYQPATVRDSVERFARASAESRRASGGKSS